jgi:hypothetical protein
MVVVGLDVERATAELDRLAPPDKAATIATARAANLRLEPAGAAGAIVRALEEPPDKLSEPEDPGSELR